jgi:hypothetical protein
MSTDALAACGSAGGLGVRYVIRFDGAPYVFLVPAHEHPLEAATGFFCDYTNLINKKFCLV